MSEHNNDFEMSQNDNSFAYSSNNNFPTAENIYVTQVTCETSVFSELCDEIRSFKLTMVANETRIKALEEEVSQCRKVITKLTEEVIAVKLENRQHHSSTTLTRNAKLDKLPFLEKEAFENFSNELENDDQLLEEFKEFIGKIGGDGQSAFVRSAIRKVFTDELASLYSWKGTKEKPSSEKLFVTMIIKNICHLKYKAGEKEINSTLQKHFVNASERLKKRNNKNNKINTNNNNNNNNSNDNNNNNSNDNNNNNNNNEIN